MAPLSIPLAIAGSRFSLNVAGVASFLGGDEAISAVATIPFYKGARWFGWYNSPGGYVVAKRFGRMADSRFRNGLFPGPCGSPAVTFGVDGKKGPQYTSLSGITMKTGHLGYLTIERSKNMHAIVMRGRKTKPMGVSYMAMESVNYDARLGRLPFWDAWILGLIPISVSMLTCILCALVYDWFSFSAILLGIVSNGLATCVIGSARLIINSVNYAASGSPPGHGILMGEDEVVVIKGKERDVHVITRGCFDLEADLRQRHRREDKENGELDGNDKGALTPHNFYDMGACTLLLMVQFLQLLLVPQGSLFGQIMFIISLFVSWGYNSYLSSLEKEKIQMRLLFRHLGYPAMDRFLAGTRTTMAVFVCLLLFHGVELSGSGNLDEVKADRDAAIRSCIPNNTPVWARWRAKVVQQILHIGNSESDSLYHLETDEADEKALSSYQLELLKDLLEDAGVACREYLRVRERLPVDSTHVG